MVHYNTWSGTVVARFAMLFLRKKFVTVIISGKIYVASDGSRTDAVEEYDPDIDTWRIKVSCGEGANGGVIFLEVFGVCGFRGFLIGIVVEVSEIVRFNFFLFTLNFLRKQTKNIYIISL